MSGGGRNRAKYGMVQGVNFLTWLFFCFLQLPFKLPPPMIVGRISQARGNSPGRHQSLQVQKQWGKQEEHCARGVGGGEIPGNLLNLSTHRKKFFLKKMLVERGG